MVTDELAFEQRYGPWALILGASDGTGAAFAREVAARGVNVVLISRRQHVLDEVADSIRAATGVETRAVAVDLAESDAFGRVSAACAGLEIGMLMYNAGADPDSRPFLDSTIEFSRSMVHRNCVVPMELCHHFAPPMVDRGRGGIVLVSSAGGMFGMRNMATYGATKAFDIVLAEALWTELHDKGVDVLALVLAATDTPAFRKHLAERGLDVADDDPIPIATVTTSEDTAADAIAHLDNGPTRFVGDAHRLRETELRQMERNDAVRDLVAALDAAESGHS